MYNVEDLLNEIRELKRDNEVIADRVHNEALKDLQEITEQYEYRIAKLKEKIYDLENPVCDCIRDPEDERKYYQNIEAENIRLRKIIKLLSESI